MFHVIRAPDGSIQSIAKAANSGTEAIDPRHPDLVQFLGTAAVDPSFGAEDAEFVRVLEDLIDTLILKNVIRHTDLPAAAQKKLMRRKGLRSSMQGALNLLGGDGQTI